jgi:uncharacterized protein affecting Mg2+/Co2+ transport
MNEVRLRIIDHESAPAEGRFLYHFLVAARENQIKTVSFTPRFNS